MAELKTAIEASLNGRAILFTGAGFSFGAKSKLGPIKTAKQLSEELAKLCDVNEVVELDVIADEFIETHGTDRLNYSTANKEISSYINYYNFQRKHSAINYQTPYQFELSNKLN